MNNVWTMLIERHMDRCCTQTPLTNKSILLVDSWKFGSDILAHILTPKSSNTTAWSVALSFELWRPIYVSIVSFGVQNNHKYETSG